GHFADDMDRFRLKLLEVGLSLGRDFCHSGPLRMGLRASGFGLRASGFGLRASSFELRASSFGGMKTSTLPVCNALPAARSPWLVARF
ncbi:hypothetical protein, partial [Chromohalobacter israelensis]|uniref:hypothetical protein n=1 Tax=Chromohalobacter israelensis TaxID=141390 RepID=UPI00196B2E69